MNILFISSFSGKKSAGLSYSIPAQIKNQRKYDNVFWYNINNTAKSKIIEGDSCYNKDDFPSLKINNLPSPFQKPDLVVFEGVYIYDYISMSRECRKRKIPYIIIPRSSLTKNAQKKKGVKKVIGNLFWFKSFVKNATAIHYLTNKEYKDSGSRWNKKYLIIPNGVETKTNTKQHKTGNKELRGVFIGRADVYQKGIDLLLDSCVNIQKELRRNNCTIDIYAPEDQDDIQKMINERELNDIVKKHSGVYGKDKEEVLLNSDFFILTSRFEGHPTGLIEALSYGIPSLVTEGTNMADEIKNINAGWIAKSSVESITREVEKIINSKKHFSQKGNKSIELSKEYDWNSLARKSHQEYKSLLDNY